MPSLFIKREWIRQETSGGEIGAEMNDKRTRGRGVLALFEAVQATGRQNPFLGNARKIAMQKPTSKKGEAG
jgi:hypothetical protein